jgi:hypothetical protein
MKNWLIIVLVIFTGVSMTAHATEEPAWTLLDTLGEVELRQYDAVIQARTPMDEDPDSSGGFRTLAGYIFGGNAQEQKIAMTAPVERTLSLENNYMAFTMPRQYSMEKLPEPEDKRVSLHEVPSRTLAVMRFSGWARDGVVQKKVQELLSTLSSHGIEPLGDPSLAQYNPPWTLPWLRRNEVVVDVTGKL